MQQWVILSRPHSGGNSNYKVFYTQQGHCDWYNVCHLIIRQSWFVLERERARLPFKVRVERKAIS